MTRRGRGLDQAPPEVWSRRHHLAALGCMPAGPSASKKMRAASKSSGERGRPACDAGPWPGSARVTSFGRRRLTMQVVLVAEMLDPVDLADRRRRSPALGDPQVLGARADRRGAAGRAADGKQAPPGSRLIARLPEAAWRRRCSPGSS